MVIPSRRFQVFTGYNITCVPIHRTRLWYPEDLPSSSPLGSQSWLRPSFAVSSAGRDVITAGGCGSRPLFRRRPRSLLPALRRCCRYCAALADTTAAKWVVIALVKRPTGGTVMPPSLSKYLMPPQMNWCPVLVSPLLTLFVICSQFNPIK